MIKTLTAIAIAGAAISCPQQVSPGDVARLYDAMAS